MDLSTREGRRQQGKLIQAAARDAGISAEELAETAGCSRALIYQYYSGATLAQTDRLQRIARAVGRSMSYFFGEDATALPVLEEPAEPAPPPPRPAVAPPPDSPLAPAPAADDLPLPNLERALADLDDLARAQWGPPDPQGVVRTSERMLALARVSGRPLTEAEALLRLGNAYGAQGRLMEAIPVLRQAVALARQVGAGSLELQASQGLGAALAETGASAEALTIFGRLSRSDAWDVQWRARVGLAALAEQAGEPDVALEHLAEVLASCDDAPSADDGALARCYARANQGNVHLSLGDLALALEAALECESEADRLGARDQRAEAMVNAGVALSGLGRYGEARAKLGLAAQLAWFAGDTPRSLVARGFAAWNEALAGRFDAAQAQARDAYREALREGDDRATALAHWNLARVHQRAGRMDEALYHAEEASRALRTLHYAADSLEAEILIAGASGKAAVSRLSRLREAAARHGFRRVEAEARVALAACGEAPAEHAASAFQTATAIGDPDLTFRAAVLMARSTRDQPEERGWCARAVDAVVRMREGDPGPEEAILEAPLRLLACRRHLQWLADQDPDAADRWLESLAWPPAEEQGPARGWEA
jgi:tetratricopeptide (TPR) repeat protein